MVVEGSGCALGHLLASLLKTWHLAETYHRMLYRVCSPCRHNYALKFGVYASGKLNL